MRFFSNDARESTDEQPNDPRPDRVQSDPVAVPNQRPPSPWSNTPPETDDTARDNAAATGTVDEGDRPPFHEPDAQPTAFGAATVGGAVAASAAAGPSSGSTYASSTASRDSDTRDGVDGHDPRDGADAVDLPLDDTGKSSSSPVSGPADPSSGPTDSGAVSTDPDTLKDDGGFDDPKAVDPATDERLDTDSASPDSASPDGSSFADDDRPVAAAHRDTATPEADTLKDDDGGFDDPKAVDPATATPLATDRAPLGSDSKDEVDKEPATDGAAPDVVGVPVVAAAPAAKPDTLFGADDARSYQDRWREVQLRFVDSPKDAAGDAAKLVDEAVETLTASLRSQRDSLANDTDDTEQLRVQLRGYREILTRIIGL